MTLRTLAWLAGAGILLAPGGAAAQAYRCAVPETLARPHAEGPTPDQPRRVLPIGGYTLAITWAPQFCRGDDPASAAFQCGAGNSFGFTLHGLWPDGEGKTWPQYCRSAALLPEATIRRNICATPSPQLLQHEYAKHGTCMGISPTRYFETSTSLYGRLRYPDMQALSRQKGLTAGRLASAVAAANPGMRANMMRITTTADGWLNEIWFCLDRKRHYRACPAHQGGVSRGTPIKIWRGRR
ncbi:ribonuclease T2 [Stakelama saccharophila]|uniref:Ribonuclease T2 n=1 Tax=Stakelama saccharophila TaxID=3075605 RepID=A0ABZ0B7I0_9SPHN|nr:ribonuclease T2 [Stakelama sp. W311]WNO53071.1 ribonuclease T2 [Stakelama sp. W311]